MNLYRNLHWFIYSIFLLSCARQSSPTGGPKDTIPPVLIKAIPPHETINLKTKKIELAFSEAVILNSPKEQLIITPTVSNDYEITYRKNLVTIEFEDPLEDSTTYTLNFRDAVQDITEKNPVRNLQLAYSTGTYIDSLSISGTIRDMLQGKPISDATVALHVENDTFNILEHRATYFTKTDKEGKFIISHLKPDNYFLYAFSDKNRNLIVNSRSESFGFIAEHQYLLENITDVDVGVVRLDAGPLKLTSARPYNTYFNIRTSKNLRTFKLTATDSSTLSYTFGENAANIRLYPTTKKDSIQIHVLALDSIDNAIDTTLYAKFSQREATPEKFTVSLSESSLLAHRGRLNATLTLTKPIGEINYDSIYYQVDSLTRVNITAEDFTWDPLQRTLKLYKEIDRSFFPEEENNGFSSRRTARTPAATEPEEKPLPLLNELHFRPGAFLSIEHDSSAQIVQSVKPMRASDLSVINIEIRTDAPSYLVQLLDNNFKVIRQIKNETRVRFEDVVPGQYQIRLIIDKNDNGRWDPGNYFNNTEPEPIVYYKGEDGSTIIKGVKANWDVGAGEMFITY